MCPPKPPKVETPAPAPPPPAPSAGVAQADPSPAVKSGEDLATRVRRTGRNSLRIDSINTSDNTGLNIPVS
jgi:hypothetical protein